MHADRTTARCRRAPRARRRGYRFLRPAADERVGRRIEPQRHGGDAADTKRDTPAAAVVVERDLRRRRGKGEIAAARIDLVEADADARLAPDRKAHRREAAGRGQRRHHRPDEEVRGGTFGHRATFAIDQRRPERHRDERDLRRRIGVGERTADGSARPDRGMADERHDLGEQRHLGADGGVVLEHALAGGRTDDDGAALVAHESKLGDARDVDQPRRPREPHRHQRDQRLPAGDDAHVVAGRQQRAGLVEMRGPFIVERCGFHRACFGACCGAARDQARRRKHEVTMRAMGGTTCPFRARLKAASVSVKALSPNGFSFARAGPSAAPTLDFQARIGGACVVRRHC